MDEPKKLIPYAQTVCNEGEDPEAEQEETLAKLLEATGQSADTEPESDTDYTAR